MIHIVCPTCEEDLGEHPEPVCPVCDSYLFLDPYETMIQENPMLAVDEMLEQQGVSTFYTLKP